MTTQASQSLFQVLYLGSTVVDQHCSHAVMPWITEQLKLRTEQRVLTWLTSGMRERGEREGGGGRRERWRGKEGEGGGGGGGGDGE